MSSPENENATSTTVENAAPETFTPDSDVPKSGYKTTITKSNSLHRIPPPTLPRPRSHPAPSSSSRRSSTSSVSSSSSASTPAANPTSPQLGPVSPGSVFQSSNKASSPVRSTGSLFQSSTTSSSGSPRSTPTSSYKSTSTLVGSSGTSTASSLLSADIQSAGPPRPLPPSLGPPAPPLQTPPGPPGPVSRQVRGTLQLLNYYLNYFITLTNK